MQDRQEVEQRMEVGHHRVQGQHHEVAIVHHLEELTESRVDAVVGLLPGRGSQGPVLQFTDSLVVLLGFDAAKVNVCHRE
jgi:hypothetical protein